MSRTLKAVLVVLTTLPVCGSICEKPLPFAEKTAGRPAVALTGPLEAALVAVGPPTARGVDAPPDEEDGVLAAPTPVAGVDT